MNFKQIILSVINFFLPFIFRLQLPMHKKYPSSAAFAYHVDYQLPYPGMLPDNPLYFLKVFRDNLTSFFINKPLDKAHFDLLQSDKDVEASYLL